MQVTRRGTVQARRQAAIRRFRATVWQYYRRHGRHALAWRRTRDPYRILVSEVMLQQTQVPRVAKFYPRFVERFPDLRALARARTAAVLRAWQGMGYNRRALALTKLAETVTERYAGRLPRERAALEALPGIGPATAGAIRAFAWNEPEIFIETNIRRAFIHFFFMKRPPRSGAKPVTDEELVRYIKRTLGNGNSRERKSPREWYWALMDYGAALGAAHRASANPNRQSARYRAQTRFAGSSRELRGKVIRTVLARGRRGKIDADVLLAALGEALGVSRGSGEKAISDLIREGFMVKKGNQVSVAS